MVKEMWLRFCPKCGSSDIGEDDSYLQKATTLVSYYFCKGCGNSGPNFPEAKQSALKKIRDEIAKREKK